MSANLSDVIGAVGQVYSVIRRAAATYGDDGRADPGATSTLGIIASVQPLGGEELMRLPEGTRTTERRVVFSNTKLIAETEEHDADLLVFDDEQWEVELVEDWSRDGGYWRCVVARVGDR